MYAGGWWVIWIVLCRERRNSIITGKACKGWFIYDMLPLFQPSHQKRFLVPKRLSGRLWLTRYSRCPTSWSFFCLTLANLSLDLWPTCRSCKSNPMVDLQELDGRKTMELENNHLSILLKPNFNLNLKYQMLTKFNNLNFKIVEKLVLDSKSVPGN